jgi:hypothetical protein
MTVSLDEQVSLRTAYQIMWVFAVRYWERGNQADVMTDYITNLGPVRDGETCDPAQIHDWLAAAEYVLAHPERSWDSYGDGEVGNDPGSLPGTASNGGVIP